MQFIEELPNIQLVKISAYTVMRTPIQFPMENLITQVGKPQKSNVLPSTKFAKLGIILQYIYSTYQHLLIKNPPEVSA